MSGSYGKTMTSRRLKYSKQLWGIEYSSKNGPRYLIGNLWHYDFMRARKFYPGEPIRRLLFETRKEARAWLKQCGPSSNLHIVRVTETVLGIAAEMFPKLERSGE